MTRPDTIRDEADRLSASLTGSGLSVRAQIALLARLTGGLFAVATQSGVRPGDLSALYDRNMAQGSAEMHEALADHVGRRRH